MKPKSPAAKVMLSGLSVIILALIGMGISITLALSRFEKVLSGETVTAEKLKAPLTKVLDDMGTYPLLFGVIATLGQIVFFIGIGLFIANRISQHRSLKDTSKAVQ